MTEDTDQWVFYMEGSTLMKRRPWCDCTREHRIKVLGRAQAQTVGYTRRHDGAWVRPCCMRRERPAWEASGDQPVAHDPGTCGFCQDRIKTGLPFPVETVSTNTGGKT